MFEPMLLEQMQDQNARTFILSHSDAQFLRKKSKTECITDLYSPSAVFRIRLNFLTCFLGDHHLSAVLSGSTIRLNQHIPAEKYELKSPSPETSFLHERSNSGSDDSDGYSLEWRATWPRDELLEASPGLALRLFS